MLRKLLLVVSLALAPLAAGFVGLWQLNICMPSSIPPGENPRVRIALDASFQWITIPLVP